MHSAASGPRRPGSPWRRAGRLTAALLGAAAWALGLVLLLDGAAGGWFIAAGALLLILSWRGTFGMWFEGLVTGGVPPDPVSGRPDPLEADTRSSGEERS